MQAMNALSEIPFSNVAHLLWGDAVYLTRSISSLVQAAMPGSSVYIRGYKDRRSKAEYLNINREWIPKCNYRDVLLYPRWLTCVAGRMKALLNLVIPEFDAHSLRQIYRGPKYWVIHGANLSLMTVVFMRLMGKRIVFIHWGGGSDKKAKFLFRIVLKLTYRMYDRILVLMSPEVRYFLPYVKASHIGTCPYPTNVVVKDFVFDSTIRKHALLMGNNAIWLKGYRETMAKIAADSGWSKIVCMLNYGADCNSPEVKDFLADSGAKFGERFVPWTQVVPYDEYCKTVGACDYYLCPAPTQAGLGAVYTSIRQGKGLILAGDNHAWITSLGITAVKLGSEILDPVELDKIFTQSVLRKNFEALNGFFAHHAHSEWRRIVLEGFNHVA